MQSTLILFLAAGMLFGEVAYGQTSVDPGNRKDGQAFALEVCTPCHVVSPKQLSPQRFSIAPSFEAIANAPTTTASGLRAFLSTSHPTMPNLILSRQEQRDVIEYIMSLDKRSP